MLHIHLLKINFNDYDFSNIAAIRKSVFTNELGIPESELFDKYDVTCDHFIIFDGKQIVGVLRLVSKEQNIKLERMAILPEYRSKNYGKHAILQLKEYYHTQGYSKIILDSIHSVRDFYKKCGFLEEGKIFRRVGIDHIRMSLTI
jgi:predicted GNAT family N-acyltransferase